MKVFLLQTEPGQDGEFEVLGVYSSRELAEAAHAHYSGPYAGPKGKSYQLESWIVVWEVDYPVLPTWEGAKRLRPTPDKAATS